MGFQFVCAEGYLIFMKEGKFFVGLSFVWDAVVKAFWRIGHCGWLKIRTVYFKVLKST